VGYAQRNADAEGGSLAELALRVDGAAVELDQLLHQGEADAGALEAAAARALHAMEALEEADRALLHPAPRVSFQTAREVDKLTDGGGGSEILSRPDKGVSQQVASDASNHAAKRQAFSIGRQFSP